MLHVLIFLGVPIMMSYPHFLRGDPLLSEPFEGLHPNPEKHEFYIDVQRVRFNLHIYLQEELSKFPH